MNSENESQHLIRLQAIVQQQNKLRNGANWFFIIAALSLINTIAFLLGSEISFVIGLGITQFFDGFATGMAQSVGGIAGTIARVVALVLDLGVFGLFVAIGYFARQRSQASFIVGIILYGLDTLIMLAFGVWLGALFHLLGLAGMWSGWQAARRLSQIEKEGYNIPDQPITMVPSSQSVAAPVVRDRKYWTQIAAAIFILLLPVILFSIYILLASR